MDWNSNSTLKKSKKKFCSTSGTHVKQTLVFGTGTVSANKFLATEAVCANKPHHYYGLYGCTCTKTAVVCVCKL